MVWQGLRSVVRCDVVCGEFSVECTVYSVERRNGMQCSRCHAV